MTVEGADLVEGIWARDPTVWTGEDEAKWLGWLDEPMRDIDLSRAPVGEYEDYVLLGMGGSSLAPEVFRRTFGATNFHVLDTTHPKAIRRLQDGIDAGSTFFLASSKSGTTLETRSHLEHFWELAGEKPEQFAVVTDPGSELEALAEERGFHAVFHGEPTIGGRYSALSAFGLVAAALMGADVDRIRKRAREMAEACRGTDNPGLKLGLQFGEGWGRGRDKICIDDTPGGFGLWAEQLIAESTGKDGKGLVPAPGESPAAPDRQHAEVRLPDPHELGAEFFRWEFATAVAGAILGINAFNQPDVQSAKDRTNEILAGGDDPDVEPSGSLDELLGGAEEGNYVCVQAFIDPTDDNESRIMKLVELIRARTGCVTTHGFGPRYLHSTGQLHKGGPPIGRFVQIVDDTGDEIPIPGKPFGFGKLIRAQAAGDFASLQERGRPIVRIRLEDL
ncbi:MAG: glucose-6-phosphate isomerase [Actinobacteria bacterium]|nr:glucose-6-phosphate isomerase [Actinomycetota bacterium]